MHRLDAAAVRGVHCPSCCFIATGTRVRHSGASIPVPPSGLSRLPLSAAGFCQSSVPLLRGSDGLWAHSVAAAPVLPRAARAAAAMRCVTAPLWPSWGAQLRIVKHSPSATCSLAVLISRCTPTVSLASRELSVWRSGGGWRCVLSSSRRSALLPVVSSCVPCSAPCRPPAPVSSKRILAHVLSLPPCV